MSIQNFTALYKSDATRERYFQCRQIVRYINHKLTRLYCECYPIIYLQISNTLFSAFPKGIFVTLSISFNRKDRLIAIFTDVFVQLDKTDFGKKQQHDLTVLSLRLLPLLLPILPNRGPRTSNQLIKTTTVTR